MPVVPLRADMARRPAEVQREMSRSAAIAHRSNDAYMAEFEDALLAMGRPSPSLPSSTPPASSSAPSVAHLGGVSPTPLPVSSSWSRGPVDPAGVVIRLCDRPLLCSSASRDRTQVVVGSSDHSVHIIDVATRLKSASLYAARGHTEWVTGVACSDDMIATCAMDARVLLWPLAATGPRTAPRFELTGHFGSVSAVQVVPVSPASLFISAGYDKTIRVWSARGECTSTGVGHAAPIMHLICAPTTAGDVAFVATGDRDGVVGLWTVDARGCSHLVGLLLGHAGQVSSLAFVPVHGALFLATGAQDGHVRTWSVLAKSCVANAALHVAADGRATGAVTDLSSCVVQEDDLTRLVSCGADRCVCVCSVGREGDLALLHRFSEHRDFIYSLHVYGRYAFSGAGNGVLICHDIVAGLPLWGVGANTAAVRCIQVACTRRGGAADTLVAAGDDGTVILYAFA